MNNPEVMNNLITMYYICFLFVLDKRKGKCFIYVYVRATFEYEMCCID